MSSVRYLRKDGKVVADFDYRKEAKWKQQWVPSQETIHEGSVPVKILGIKTKPSTVVYMESVSVDDVVLYVEFDNESIQEKHPSSIVCDTSVLGETDATANYSTLTPVTFKITVVAPPNQEEQTE